MNYLNWNSLFKSFALALIAFISPIKWLIIGVGALILLDTLSGLYRAYKLKQEITSKRFGHIVSKLLLYNIAIISGYILQLMIGLEILPLAKIISVAIGLTELKSITENVNEITGIDLWQFIQGYLRRNSDSLSETIKEGLEGKKA
jgi:DNA integrity scanning protein DisA with diadenylate cyclase activity